ncbi:Uma2 family endonuclease [Streptomyces sp. NPDC004647]|uniref:Uma2 family endonuclease n=1 Tax=Streptomyces sp. NPDC004647 TaxID=3154671 RepID=UPI0033A152BC
MAVMLEHPMTIDVPGSPRFQELCRTLMRMDVPDGYRAEIIGGNIVMSPWSQGYYLPIMRSIRTQLEPYAPQGHTVDYAPYLFTFPTAERAYGPDVFAAEGSAFRTRKRHIDGEALSFVAELTSASTRDSDWDDKTPVYGKSGVPVYLLLDMQESAATLFWNPSAQGYGSRLTVPFGEKLHVPAPFDCELDTADFEAHEPEG